MLRSAETTSGLAAKKVGSLRDTAWIAVTAAAAEYSAMTNQLEGVVRSRKN